MTNMHGDNESDSGDDNKSHHPHKKPNLYVGIIIASILIASPFILYNYFSSPTEPQSQSQQLTPIEGEEPIVPVPPASEINPESINMIQSSIDNLQQSIINLDSKLNQQTNQLFQLSQSEKKEEESKDKSMFNFSDLNPFAEKKEETPAPPSPSPSPSPSLNPIDPSPPVNPNPSFNFNPTPKPLEQTPVLPPTQSDEPPVNFNDSEPNPPTTTANTEFKTGGQKRTYRKKHGKKQNYSKKLLNKFLKKLSTL
jgi:hypothetical protein